MKILSCEEKGKSCYEFHVLIESDEFGSEVERSYRRKSKSLAVPGFRKGRVPRAFVEKYYGVEFFFEDAINELYPNVVDFLFKNSSKKLIRGDMGMNAQLVNADLEKGAELKMEINAEPKLEFSTSYKNLEIHVNKKKEVTDLDVKKFKDGILKSRAKFVSVNGRTAKSGDVVKIDFEGKIGGEKFEGGSAKGVEITLGSKKFIPGFEEQVSGHNKGESFEISLTFPEDYPISKFAGKNAVFSVKLHDIKEPRIPELNDKFLKSLKLGLENIEQFNDWSRKRIEGSRESEYNEDLDKVCENRIVEITQGDIPKLLVESRANSMYKEFEFRVLEQGLKMEDYFNFTGMTEKGIKENLRPEAEQSVRMNFALKKIAEEEHVNVSKEDIEDFYSGLSKNYGISIEKVKESVKEEEVKETIGLQKAFEIVKNSAVIIEE
ncbi:MAG: trigger factor [Oscillospiraceae bacterium]|jgi:trigger factor|nr:trigger factor [Oscillospiraceae bacterium]